MREIYKAHDYQGHAEDLILNNPKTGLFLQMGLGKTVVTLSAIEKLMYSYFKVKKVLVVAPKKVALKTWPDELDKWDHLKNLTYTVFTGKSPAKRLKALEEDTHIHIINVDNLTWLFEQFGSYKDPRKKLGFYYTKLWPYDMVVIDESSMFKRFTTKRFKVIETALGFIERIVELTGTPSPKDLLDLWAQVYLLDQGSRLGSFKEYQAQYFEASGYVRQSGFLVPTGYKLRSPELEDQIYKAISDICFSMQGNDHLEMPDIVYNNLMIELTPEQRELYNELEKEFILEINGEVIDAQSAASLSSKLEQLAQGAVYHDAEHNYVEIHDQKLQALEHLYSTAEENPILVFYWFKHDLERLKARFPEARELKTSQDQDDWNDGKIPLLFAHPASAGHGLNLQMGGSTIIWFSMVWNLELYLQANARLYRQGQKSAVVVNHLMIKDSLDEVKLQTLSERSDGQQRLMDAVKTIVAKYS